MKKNNNVVVLKEDVKIGNLVLEAGDALVKTSNGWMIVEAEGDEEDKKEDEMEEEEEEDKDTEDDKEDKDEKKEESKKK